MKKILLVTFLVISLTLLGCTSSQEENTNNNNNTNQEENTRDNNNARSIDNLEEFPGPDPLVERYPGSVRRNCVQGVFCIYVAEATTDEVLAFYQDLATQRGNPFNHEILPEDHPHWVNTSEDLAEQALDEFSFTLGESEESCQNCVEWVLYSLEWPEN